MLGDESKSEAAFQRVSGSVTHAKIRRAVESSIEFLSVKEVLDVADFVVYRAYLSARAKAIRNDKPVPSFEQFLLSFLESKSVNTNE